MDGEALSEVHSAEQASLDMKSSLCGPSAEEAALGPSHWSSYECAQREVTTGRQAATGLNRTSVQQ